MTGRDLVSASMRLIGALAAGESPDAQEATDGLASINRMIDSWSTEGLLIYAITQEAALTLTAGDATVTMGASGDITTRPQKIVAAAIRDGSMDYPVSILSAEEYAAIPNKSVQSTYPTSLYDDGGYPQRTLTLYPVPNAAKSLVLFTKRALSTITSLDTAVSLPPGYERALVYNGALELAPEFGRPVPDAVAMIAMESKAGLKRANHRGSYLRVDSALMPSPSQFNIYTGDYRR
jgi:hypothetical protein